MSFSEAFNRPRAAAAALGLQTNVTFFQPYDPAGPSEALPMTDATNYLLANFGSVAEVRRELFG